MNTNVLISVILPFYNNSNTINEAVDGVLKQCNVDLELIIIDDGSSVEHSLKLNELTDTRIKIIRNDVNIGIAKSLNKGIEHSKGSYIARIDSDDIWIDENKLKKQVDFLERNTNFALIGTASQSLDENGIKKNNLVITTDFSIRNNLLLINPFIHTTVMFTRDSFNSVGKYSDEYPFAEDYHLWLKLGEKYNLGNIRDLTTIYRIRTDGITVSKNKEINLSYIRLIWKFRKSYPKVYLALLRKFVRYLILIFFGIEGVTYLKKMNIGK